MSEGPEGAARRHRAPSPVALRSAVLVRFMGRYFDYYAARHLNGVRLAKWGRPALPPEAGPLVVYCNHPSWWDAALFILLGRRHFPGHEGYAPIDAAMLEKYGFFRRMGAFGLESDRPAGARAFLATAREILAAPHRALWITAQGRFADARERPLVLRAGVGRLAELAPAATFLPLAIELTFWEERGAEALCAFGAPLAGRELAARPRPERMAVLTAALGGTLDRLAGDVMARDPARFEAVSEGRKGVGGIYDLWRRTAARLTGRSFEPAHGARPAGR